MPDQPTPKPLDAEAEAKMRALYAGNDWFEAAAVLDSVHYTNAATCLRKNAVAVRGLIASLDASRAESATLRAAVAEAEKQRDEAKEQFYDLEIVMSRSGWRRCDIPACNCGSWHQPPNLRAEKAEQSRDALAAELAAARKVLEGREQATENLIRHAIEVADFIEDEYADGNDDGDIIPVSSPAHKLHSCLWGAIFKADLPDGAVTLAARDSAGKASGGGGE